MWGRRILVLLDDAANAAQVEPLLPASPTCAVLIASRDVLKDLDGVHRERLKVLEPNAATELLGKFVGPERVAREPEAANAIAGYCDNMPLALRIAGAKLAARPDNWSLATLADRLADERQRLPQLQAGELAVRASFGLSYESLGPTSQRTFRPAWAP